MKFGHVLKNNPNKNQFTFEASKIDGVIFI